MLKALLSVLAGWTVIFATGDTFDYGTGSWAKTSCENMANNYPGASCVYK